MTEVGILAAFFAGLLSLLSPCSALLLPSFFAYAFASKRALLARTCVFYVGLTLTLVPLGTGASAASAFFYGNRPLLIAVAGWSIIALGILQLFGRGFTIPFTEKLSAAVAARNADGWLSTLLLGAVYGLAGFCSGPVLGAILTVAATQATPWRGGGLLAVYALGMAGPLFVLALLWDRYELGRRRWLRGRAITVGRLRLHSMPLVSGLMFVLIGAIFLRYDGTAGLAGSLGISDLTDLEFDLQQAASKATSDIPIAAVLALLVLGASLTAWRRAKYLRRVPPSEDSDTPDGARRDRHDAVR